MWIRVPNCSETQEAFSEEIDFMESIQRCGELGVGAQRHPDQGISGGWDEFYWEPMKFLDHASDINKSAFL